MKTYFWVTCTGQLPVVNIFDPERQRDQEAILGLLKKHKVERSIITFTPITEQNIREGTLPDGTKENRLMDLRDKADAGDWFY